MGPLLHPLFILPLNQLPSVHVLASSVTITFAEDNLLTHLCNQTSKVALSISFHANILKSIVFVMYFHETILNGFDGFSKERQ